MGIRGLDNYVEERKLAQTAPLSALTGARLGIDAKLYINQLLDHDDSKEPFVQATGGLPLSIPQRIENDFQTFTRYKITPVFIFSGLPMKSIAPPRTWGPTAERIMKAREQAWDMYEEGRTKDASDAFGQIKGGADIWRDMFRMVLRVLKNRMVEYIICPYLEHSQLNYLLNRPNKYIHAIYATNEALLWPVDKLITSIDFPSSFTFIDKSKLLLDLGLSDDRFLDLGILVGSFLSRTLPVINTVAPEHFIKTAADIIKTHQSGLGAVDFFTSREPARMTHYREDFIKARTAVRHGFVLTTEGNVVPLPLAISSHIQAADVPYDIDTIFSQRLPQDLYYYICKGMISPLVVGWLTTGNVAEHAPLSDSGNYQGFVKTKITESETSQRVLCLAILLDTLNARWSENRIAAHYYFDQHNPVGYTLKLDGPETISLVKSLSTWTMPLSYLKDELRRQNASTVDICLCIGTMANPAMVEKSLQKHDKPLDKKDEFVSNAIWRYLTVRKFINIDHTLSIAGQGLHAALNASRGNDRFHEPLTVIIELHRFGSLYGYRIGGEYRSGGPVGEDETEFSSSMLILRCLSVLPLNLRPQQWVGPLSRELLVFNSFAKAVQKSSRLLMEVVCTHMLLTGAAKRQRDDWDQILLSLPFQSDCNTGFGVLFKAYLDYALYSFTNSTKDDSAPPQTPDSVESDPNSTINEHNKDSEAVKQAKEDALVFVEEIFTSVKGVRQEVERGFRFWDAVLVAVRTMSKLQLESKTSPNKEEQTLSDVEYTLGEFESADKWLQPMRP